MCQYANEIPEVDNLDISIFAYWHIESLLFLYTDTGCNYRFYDTHGLRCLAQQAHENPYKKDRPFWVFLYGVYETAFS